MPEVKVYNRINWENEPSIQTPLNETNMNLMDDAINKIDNRVVSLLNNSATKTDIESLIKDVTYNDTTGEFTITKNDATSTKTVIDTDIEKIPIDYKIYNTAESGKYKKIFRTTSKSGAIKDYDIALLNSYDFESYDEILFFTSETNRIGAKIKRESITVDHLNRDLYNIIRDNENKTFNYMTLAKSWCAGGTSVRFDEATNNSKYWAEQAQRYAGVASGNAINYRGDFVITNSYSELDAVYYEGSTYVSKVNNPSSAPAEGADWRYLAKGFNIPMQFVSKNDYDALPVSKLTDDVLYFVN